MTGTLVPSRTAVPETLPLPRRAAMLPGTGAVKVMVELDSPRVALLSVRTVPTSGTCATLEGRPESTMTSEAGSMICAAALVAGAAAGAGVPSSLSAPPCAEEESPGPSPEAAGRVGAWEPTFW